MPSDTKITEKCSLCKGDKIALVVRSCPACTESECSRLASRVEELERIVGDMFTLLDQCCDSEDWREWVARWRADAVSVLAGAHAEEKE